MENIFFYFLALADTSTTSVLILSSVYIGWRYSSYDGYYLYKFFWVLLFFLSKDFQMGAEVYASPEKGAVDWVIILV